MHRLSLRELIHGLQQRDFSSLELTQHFLHRIEQYSQLNAFIHIDKESALHSAHIADKRLAEGEAPPLTGIPLAHKDIFCTLKMPTTCGSKMLANFISPYSATIVNRLHEAGTILLGKTNMDEFAMGSSNENSYFGAVLNPWNHSYVAGGSSGGSAASVAAGLVPFATASDTGGSIRQPAAFCNVTGLKPTYGLVSRFGMVAYASSFDQAGPIAHSAEDLAIILPTMAGFDANDSTSVSHSLPNYTQALTKSIRTMRIGVPNTFRDAICDDAIREAFDETLAAFAQLGAEIIPLHLSLQDLWVPCYYVLASAEASSNLARYDGIRYGHRATKADTTAELITQSRSEGFGLEVQRRILTGTYVLSAGYFDAYYIKAQKIRRLIQQELSQALKQVDVILGPTTPTTAFKLDRHTCTATELYAADIFTVAANLAGLPALSMPAGFSPDGLPIGMQLLGAHFGEERLLNLAHHYQQTTNWHRQQPGDV